MTAKILIFLICVEAIIYWLLYNLHDCTFNVKIPLCCCYLLSLENRTYTKYCTLFSVWTPHRSRRKFLIRNLTGLPGMNFITDQESKTVNQPGLQTNLTKNCCYYAKTRVLQKKILFTKRFFFQASGNPLIKRNDYKMKVVR